MPTQQAGQQQKVGVGGQGSLGSTWSDPSVNISLDFLSAGLNPTKTPPTLNNIIQQQGIMLICCVHIKSESSMCSVSAGCESNQKPMKKGIHGIKKVKGHLCHLKVFNNLSSWQ